MRGAPPRQAARWQRAALHAVPIAAVMLALYAYWFGLANRYAVFLYGHLDAEPFDAVTRSRYWMAGLVAAGLVLLLYNGLIWLAARFRPVVLPSWWRVWLITATLLVPGIFFITMTLNTPTLPLGLAAASTVAALSGLAVALLPAQLAAHHPAQLALLALDGLALSAALLLMPALELPGEGLSISAGLAVAATVGGIVGSLLGLGVLTTARRWLSIPSPPARQVLLAGLAWAYLLWPVAHHLLATPPGYKYISTAANFFAQNLLLQAATLGVAMALALITTQFRTRRTDATTEMKRRAS